MNEQVLCEVCGEITLYSKIKRCDKCWNMEAGLRFLTRIDKKLAIKWLEDNLMKLRSEK